MKQNEIYLIADGVHHREEKFGLMIISKTTPVLLFNDDMKVVWHLIYNGSSYEQIIDAVKAQYVDLNVESKVDEIIDTLIRIGLIYVKEE